MAIDPVWQWFILIIGILYTIVAGIGTHYLEKFVKWKINRGKTWLISLNSNNKTGKVELVSAGREGYQPKGDRPYIKFEGTHCYIDRDANRPMFVVNEDTGKIIAAKEGETEELDGNVLAKFMGNGFIERIASAGDGTDWAKIATIVGIFGLLGLVVIGIMLARIMPGLSGGA